jgi:hypothetical protein
MNRIVKKLFTFVFLVFLSTALVMSCSKQAKEGDHPAGEHPSDSTEHPADSTEHLTQTLQNILRSIQQNIRLILQRNNQEGLPGRINENVVRGSVTFPSISISG